MMYYRSTPLIFWPFVALYSIVEMILKLAGRIVAAVLGVALMIVGAVLSLTIIGAVIGIPIGGFGFTMMIRGFF
ncbi:MAG: hypothetical protein N3I35_18615 [Clostridia bacterium]|nr:hypothetical protein [Clostridia bacterium]